jgi:hypothetical protein
VVVFGDGDGAGGRVIVSTVHRATHDSLQPAHDLAFVSSEWLLTASHFALIAIDVLSGHSHVFAYVLHRQDLCR